MLSTLSAHALARDASTEDIKVDKRNRLQDGWVPLAISIGDPRTVVAIVCAAPQAPSQFAEFVKEPAAACSGRSFSPRTVRHHNVVELSDVAHRPDRPIEVLISAVRPSRSRMGRTFSHFERPK
jgi:hypothetical protein